MKRYEIKFVRNTRQLATHESEESLEALMAVTLALSTTEISIKSESNENLLTTRTPDCF